jgi:hypothetical protein
MVAIAAGEESKFTPIFQAPGAFPKTEEADPAGPASP